MKGKRFSIYFLNLFILFVVFSASFAEEICVDPAGPICYDTIQDAVDTALTGDIITVAPGTYDGFSSSNNITVKGEEPSTTVIVTSTGVAVKITANRLILSGFYITGATHGVEVKSALNISNCIIAGSGSNGIQFSTDSSCSVTNCTIAFNGSSGLYFSDPDAQNNIRNSIIAFNGQYGIRATESYGNTNPDCEYSDIYGNPSGDLSDVDDVIGNIFENPLFVDQEVGDYRIQSTTLCIDAGNPSITYIDPDGTRNDMGAYGGPDASSFCQYPDCGPVIISIDVTPISVPQGSSITIRATGSVRE